LECLCWLPPDKLPLRGMPVAFTHVNYAAPGACIFVGTARLPK
jgi:hypothetical protein